MRLIIKDYRHWKFKYEIMRFGVLLLIAALFWIGIELFSTYTNSVRPVPYQQYLEPLNPALDLQVLEDLADRVTPSEDFSIVTEQQIDQESSGSAVPASGSAQL